MDYKHFIELVVKFIELAGVLAILGGLLFATAIFLIKWIKEKDLVHGYRAYRQNIGRSILLGLEFLVAGDIIRSIAVPPTLNSVVELVIIILIRTFLAIELEMEIKGRWPWQEKGSA